MSEDDITDAQRNFAQSVKIEPFFRTAPITAKPGRKIYFPPDVAVSKYVTKSSIQFRVKDTDYVLELAKFEEFRCSITAGHVRWTPPRVRWGAFLMNPKWERILGNRNNRPKHLGIDSLFPPGPPKGQNHNDSDFEVLLQVIKRVAEVLSPLPQTGERAPSDDEEAEAAGVLDSGLGTLF